MSDLVEYEANGFSLKVDRDENAIVDQWVIHFMKAYFEAGFLNDLKVTIKNKHFGDSKYKIVIDAESESYEVFGEGGLHTKLMIDEGLI